MSRLSCSIGGYSLEGYKEDTDSNYSTKLLKNGIEIAKVYGFKGLKQTKVIYKGKTDLKCKELERSLLYDLDELFSMFPKKYVSSIPNIRKKNGKLDSFISLLLELDILSDSIKFWRDLSNEEITISVLLVGNSYIQPIQHNEKEPQILCSTFKKTMTKEDIIKEIREDIKLKGISEPIMFKIVYATQKGLLYLSFKDYIRLYTDTKLLK